MRDVNDWLLAVHWSVEKNQEKGNLNDDIYVRTNTAHTGEKSVRRLDVQPYAAMKLIYVSATFVLRQVLGTSHKLDKLSTSEETSKCISTPWTDFMPKIIASF